MKHSDLATPDGTKALFGSADFLGKNVTVFDIGGNKYRLSATMRYDMQRVFIRQVMTHAEYVRRSADGTLQATIDIDMTSTLNISAPRPIRTQREYDAAVAEIDRLLDEDPAARSDAADRLELLSLVVEAFDDKHHVGPVRSDPPSVVLFVLAQQGKTRVDLVPILGSKSRVSEFLHSKRRLSLAQVAALRRELGIPADLLIELDGDAAEHTDVRAPRAGSAGRVSEPAAAYGAASAPVNELVPVLRRVAEQLERLTALLEANAMQLDGVVNAVRGAARESAASAWRRAR